MSRRNDHQPSSPSHCPGRAGFTLLELQVAIVLLTIGLVTLASLLATQGRLSKRLERGFAPAAARAAGRNDDGRRIVPTARASQSETVMTPFIRG